MEKKKKVTHRNLDSLGFNRNIETLLNLFYPVVWPDAHICSPGVLSDQPGLAPEAPHTSLPITALSATSLDREQRQTTLECRHRARPAQMDERADEHMRRHTHMRTRAGVTRSNDTGAGLSVRLTALSPSGRAPLSSLHSFRYLAETFSLCLPFSKTCFMLGALQT